MDSPSPRQRNPKVNPPWTFSVEGTAHPSARISAVIPWVKNVASYAFAVVLLTTAHGIRFYNEPRLTVGQIASEEIVAPFDASIEDTQATAEKMARVRDSTQQFVRVDPQANAAMNASLQQRIAQANRLRSNREPTLFVSTAILTADTQTFLQQLSPDEWASINVAASGGGESATSDYATLQAIGELQELFNQPLDSANGTGLTYAALIAQIEVAQQRYRSHQAELYPWPPQLYTWSEEEWNSVQQALPIVLRRIQSIGIAEGLPREVKRQGILAQLETLPSEISSGLGPVLLDVTRPNLELDRQKIEAQVQSRLANVEPVLIQKQVGETIVLPGETITQSTFDVLDHYNLAQRRVNLWGLLQVSGVMVGVMVIFVPLQSLIRPNLRTRDRCLLLLLLSTVAPTALGLGLPSTSLPAVGLLGGSYYGGWMGLLLVGVASALLPLATGVGYSTLAPSLFPIVTGSLLACVVAPRLRSREELALLGGGAALMQAFAYAAVPFVLGNPISWSAAAIAGGSGLLWSIVALGASPNLEPLFDLVTPIRLAELANPNRPLLRRLAEEAPGTYQHTLFVASLAERAAQKLKLNAELVRTGTLYHDIGKMPQAQYFIENQMGGPNLHDEINDPYKSAEIIIDHVRDGLKLARQYRLPTAIRAFIPEHQGTIRVAFFLHQAKLQAPPDEPFDESPFRYDGPIPQTRETGVVMLADACEAALRSLHKNLSGDIDSYTLEEARKTILSIFRSRWQDGQLTQSGLLREEMDTIADVFLQVWRESYHDRIPYPSSSSPSLRKS